jgi:hypothetical protein
LSRPGKILGLAGLAALVLVGSLAASVVVFKSDALLGCRLFSVDQDGWVAANRRMLEDLPVYPGSVLMYESSNGGSVAKDRCLPAENSGPYDSFTTSVRYRMPAGSNFADVADFYERELTARGWRPGWHSGRYEFAYVRGDAFITVRSGVGAPFWEFVANHDRSGTD